jgi:hypothetical protein
MRFTQVMMLFGFALIAGPCFGQWSGREDKLAAVEKTFGDPPGMTRLDRVSRVWADKQNKRVVVDGYIALTAGQLEMLACPVGTKEHESVIAVFSKAHVIHAGLLAVGAKPGTPVKWEPQFSPPSGSEIQVFALWKDEEGKKHSIDARKWVQELGTEDKNLSVNFVFAGSGFWKDPDTGKSEYLAESGDLICVSNFSTAMLDIPVESAQANSGLLFVAFTERIPEKSTPVRLVLQVVDPKNASAPRNTLTANESEDALKLSTEQKAQADKQATQLQELIGQP